MRNFVFIAPPAAGKGTQSKFLVEKYGYNHISTGDLLREEVANKTTLGIQIEEIHLGTTYETPANSKAAAIMPCVFLALASK